MSSSGVSVADLLWLFVAGTAFGVAGVSAADHFVGLTGYEWAVGVALFVFANYQVRKARRDREPEVPA